jgi:hypothetical protein
MDKTKAETDGLETLEERNNPLPRVGQIGSSEVASRIGSSWKEPWHMSASPVVNEALNNGYFREIGLKSIKVRYQELRIA